MVSQCVHAAARDTSPIRKSGMAPATAVNNFWSKQGALSSQYSFGYVIETDWNEVG